MCTVICVARAACHARKAGFFQMYGGQREKERATTVKAKPIGTVKQLWVGPGSGAQSFRAQGLRVSGLRAQGSRAQGSRAQGSKAQGFRAQGFGGAPPPHTPILLYLPLNLYLPYNQAIKQPTNPPPTNQPVHSIGSNRPTNHQPPNQAASQLPSTYYQLSTANHHPVHTETDRTNHHQ